MNLSKSLLQAVFVGMTAGAMVTSCTVAETLEDIETDLTEVHNDVFNKDGNNTEGTCGTDGWDCCMACGLG